MRSILARRMRVVQLILILIAASLSCRYILGYSEQEDLEGADVERIELVSVQEVDGWCLPESAATGNHICGYKVRWEIKFNNPEPSSKILCHVISADVNTSDTFSGMTFEQGPGKWEHSMEITGFYPGLGDYGEHFSCALERAPFDGSNLILQTGTDITASFTTLRED
ncbi:MAG: hypothetical protein OEV06_08850 [Anaerolineae bacterium]|nr:hypothetical protein [Anaerolineae bacterium]